MTVVTVPASMVLASLDPASSSNIPAVVTATAVATVPIERVKSGFISATTNASNDLIVVCAGVSGQ